LPAEWRSHCVLASGSLMFCKEVLGKLNNHFGPYLYAVDMNFVGLPPRQLKTVLGPTNSGGRQYLDRLGLMSSVLAHADYSGVTLAMHLFAYWNVESELFGSRAPFQRKLDHFIDPAAIARH
jgi:hypothetical protein